VLLGACGRGCWLVLPIPAPRGKHRLSSFLPSASELYCGRAWPTGADNLLILRRQRAGSRSRRGAAALRDAMRELEKCDVLRKAPGQRTTWTTSCAGQAAGVPGRARPGERLGDQALPAAVLRRCGVQSRGGTLTSREPAPRLAPSPMNRATIAACLRARSRRRNLPPRRTRTSRPTNPFPSSRSTVT
jgi:hypothetical protein